MSNHTTWGGGRLGRALGPLGQRRYSGCCDDECTTAQGAPPRECAAPRVSSKGRSLVHDVHDVGCNEVLTAGEAGARGLPGRALSFLLTLFSVQKLYYFFFLIKVAYVNIN